MRGFPALKPSAKVRPKVVGATGAGLALEVMMVVTVVTVVTVERVLRRVVVLWTESRSVTVSVVAASCVANEVNVALASRMLVVAESYSVNAESARQAHRAE
jgi:hypothetical protein